MPASLSIIFLRYKIYYVTRMAKTAVQQSWHSISHTHISDILQSDPDVGLTPADAEKFLLQYGANKLSDIAVVPAWKRFFSQFHNLLIYVLLFAAALALLLGEFIDMGVILAVVFANVLIGYIQEGKAEKALNAIRGLLAGTATVIREGKRLEIAAELLVPGDLIWLEAGDKVSADVRLFITRNLHIQEAALTGESVPVEKSDDILADTTLLADRVNMAYSGTLVTQGQGTGIVVATGENTELGRINQLISDVDLTTTPLLQQMNVFARYMTSIVLSVAALVFIIGLFRGHEAQYLFMAVVSLVVASIPEGLPTILTVALAIGVTRMAHRHAIIRKLPAAETLGAVSVICSDKTGTLTRNEMMAATLIFPGSQFEVEGNGYQPQGNFVLAETQQQINPAEIPELHWFCITGVLCGNAVLRQENGIWVSEGDPMEAALLTLAAKAGLQQQQVLEQYPRSDEIPFDSGHKYMVSLHHDQQNKGYVFIKGAPEQLIQMCDAVYDGQSVTAINKAYWQDRIEQTAQKGQRILALAMKPLETPASSLDEIDLTSGLQLLGLVGLIDPPRSEVIPAIQACHTAGIRVKMITGDHVVTALAIAKKLKLTNTAEALSGAELEQLSKQQLQQKAAEVDVFARTTPEHKLRLVQALQARGAVVAMTGDGVNDAPALKQADVGIAMGKGGTEAAREASEMVLADDNFASIVNAVNEGRTVYDNLKKALVFLLPINGGESLAITLALLFSLILPILPLQILWVNMISSICLALALSFESSEKNVMLRPPRGAKSSLLSYFLLWRVILVSILFTVGIFGIFQWALLQGYPQEYARTLAVNTLVAMEVWYLFHVRNLYGKPFSFMDIKSARPVWYAILAVVILQGAFTYLPALQRLFSTRPLHFTDIVLCIIIAILVFIILEAEKWLRYKYNETFLQGK